MHIERTQNRWFSFGLNNIIVFSVVRNYRILHGAQAIVMISKNEQNGRNKTVNGVWATARLLKQVATACGREQHFQVLEKISD